MTSISKAVSKELAYCAKLKEKNIRLKKLLKEAINVFNPCQEFFPVEKWEKWLAEAENALI
jgi:hypothetical protein